MKIAARRTTVKDVIEKNKLIPEDKLKPAVEESKRNGIPLQQVIINMNLIEKTILLRKLSDDWGIKVVDVTELEIEPEIAKLIPETSARRHRAIPFAKEENTLFVAMVDPRDLFAIEDIHLRTGFDVLSYLSLPDDITKSLDKFHGVGEVGEETVSKILSTVGAETEEMKLEKAGEEKADISEIDATAPEVEKIVNALILGALQKKASDIHIEPYEKKVLLRYRIDGVLQDAPFTPPYAYRNALIAKLKIMTESMNITEHRRPQDGRIQLVAGGKPVEFRVNIIPTVFGESCVMRILDRSAIMVEMAKLGFLPNVLEKLGASLKKPYGLILVCGPTGSGKSTTLYSALNFINNPEIKIVTAENPVEYNLPGVVQLNVHQEIGLDFSSALRAFLRQDPDVMMVGEIRDKETATIAMEASMTGHLVLSTIHTNDAASAVARLYEMGALPFMIVSTVECVLAQRLVRKICPDCRQKAKPTEEHTALFKEHNIDTSKMNLYKGKGCPTCNESGYKGRLGIHEFLPMTDEMKTLALKEFSSGPIHNLAVKQGMLTLVQDGLTKVVMGMTTLEEILRVSQK
jgi:type IV pilus assembly protein PilB